MQDADFPQFLEALTTLECFYRTPVDKRLNRQESTSYFRMLRQFPIEVVDEAVERAPVSYPSFFPKAGELRAVAEAVMAEFRYAKQEKTDHQKYLEMAHCAHEFVEHLEPPDSFFVKFDVCWKCDLAKPTINRSAAFAKQRQYFEAGLKAKGAAA